MRRKNNAFTRHYYFSILFSSRRFFKYLFLIKSAFVTRTIVKFKSRHLYMNDTKRSIIIIHFRFFAFTIFNCNLIFFLCLNVCVVGQVYRARHIIINLMHFFALGGWQNVRKANKSVATQKNMQPFQLVNVENKFNEKKTYTNS